MKTVQYLSISISLSKRNSFSFFQQTLHICGSKIKRYWLLVICKFCEWNSNIFTVISHFTLLLLSARIEQSCISSDIHNIGNTENHLFSTDGSSCYNNISSAGKNRLAYFTQTKRFRWETFFVLFNKQKMLIKNISCMIQLLCVPYSMNIFGGKTWIILRSLNQSGVIYPIISFCVMNIEWLFNK